ncbi:hypothetical protein ZWY2020_058116 [Hordeum vulgare]|nr:hypothetical protein ZWY2020_058116 [Hordeum vulgare]
MGLSGSTVSSVGYECWSAVEGGGVVPVKCQQDTVVARVLYRGVIFYRRTDCWEWPHLVPTQPLSVHTIIKLEMAVCMM